MMPGRRRSQKAVFKDELNRQALVSTAAVATEATARAGADASLDGRLDTVEPALVAAQDAIEDAETAIGSLASDVADHEDRIEALEA